MRLMCLYQTRTSFVMLPTEISWGRDKRLKALVFLVFGVVYEEIRFFRYSHFWAQVDQKITHMN